jgi:hypothetical protein
MRSIRVSPARKTWLKGNTGGRLQLEILERGKMRSFSRMVTSVGLLSRLLQVHFHFESEYDERDTVLRSCSWPCLHREMKRYSKVQREAQIEVSFLSDKPLLALPSAANEKGRRTTVK